MLLSMFLKFCNFFTVLFFKTAYNGFLEIYQDLKVQFRGWFMHSGDLAQRQAQSVSLLQALHSLVQEVAALLNRIATQVNTVTHAEQPDIPLIEKECALYLAEFQKISTIIIRLKSPIDEKINELKERGPLQHLQSAT